MLAIRPTWRLRSRHDVERWPWPGLRRENCQSNAIRHEFENQLQQLGTRKDAQAPRRIAFLLFTGATYAERVLPLYLALPSAAIVIPSIAAHRSATFEQRGREVGAPIKA